MENELLIQILNKVEKIDELAQKVDKIDKLVEDVAWIKQDIAELKQDYRRLNQSVAVLEKEVRHDFKIICEIISNAPPFYRRGVCVFQPFDP